jgi:hypothetical protein
LRTPLKLVHVAAMCEARASSGPQNVPLDTVLLSLNVD